MTDPPAPPPCEACESHDRKCKSQCSIDRMTHHAEIAELRARIEGLAKEWDVGSWNVDENARDAARRLRAILAPKVEP